MILIQGIHLHYFFIIRSFVGVIYNIDGKVVAVIGDGALTGGMAFEALSHAGQLAKFNCYFKRQSNVNK